MELREYQQQLAIQAAALLKKFDIAYLALEMRVGKTITSLQAAKLYGSRSVLFVTKKKAIESVIADYYQLDPGFLLKVINYEQIVNFKGDPDLIIIDEAHACGSFPHVSERARNLKQICKHLPIIYLSGTPTPESYSQIYHQFWISSFSPFDDKNFYAWAHKYVNIKKKYFNGLSFNVYTDARQEEIEAKISHLFLTYTQEQAGFITKTDDEVIRIQMDAKTYVAASLLIKNRVFKTRDGLTVLADTSVRLMQKLHQIYSGTVLVEPGGGTSAVCFDRSKVSFIKQHFAGKKIAVFYKFKAEELMLRAHLGGLITDDPQVFNNTEFCTFISQIQSGREGINLSTADALVYMNIDFSATSYIQSRARLQAKDRTTPAKAYYVFANGGIEEKIYARVVHKMNFTKSYFEKTYGIKGSAKSQVGPGAGRLAGSQDNAMLKAGVA